MDARSTNLARRSFLLAAGLGGVGAALVARRSASSRPPAVAASSPTAPQRGYSETPHVRSYYRSTRI